MNDFLMSGGNILLRTVLSFLVLFLLSRFIGVRQISQMTFYDYIVGITIGSIAATLTLDDDIPIYAAILAMILFALLTVVVSRLNLKSVKMRKFFSGTPSIVIDNGIIIEKNMQQNHYNINDLLSECRQNGYFNITDIQYAILEMDGRLSILPKAGKRPLEPDDIGLTVPVEGLITNLVIDGVILHDNLQTLGKDEQWLYNQLKAQKVPQVKDVLLAVGDDSGNVTVYRKNQTTQNEDHFI